MTSNVVYALAVGFLIGCTPSTTVVNSPGPSGGLPEGISVTGVGEAHGPPTIAKVTIGVETRAVGASEAIGNANQRMQAVLAALTQAGVAGADVQTNNLSLSYERTSYAPPEPPPPVPATTAPGKPGVPSKTEATATRAEPAPASLPEGFYRASNTVSVTIRDLPKIGQILGAATTAGADEMLGIEFRIEDTSALETKARELAVADAKLRAERLAQLSGVKLGRPVSIIESNAGHSPPSYGYEMRAAAMNKVPVEGGSLTVQTQVQVVYELAK
jgi:uncharacterized protein YggE